jgi:hypothetical protein
MKVSTELQNCSLEIKYIGTPLNIAFQELFDTIMRLSNSFKKELAEGLKEASKVLKSFSEQLEK